MIDSFTPFVLSISGIGVAGFVAWTLNRMVKNSSDLSDFKLYVSEHCIKKDEMSEVKVELKYLTGLMNQIAGKLNVKVAAND